jgi:hypothetical protein
MTTFGLAAAMLFYTLELATQLLVWLDSVQEVHYYLKLKT